MLSTLSLPASPVASWPRQQVSQHSLISSTSISGRSFALTSIPSHSHSSQRFSRLILRSSVPAVVTATAPAPTSHSSPMQLPAQLLGTVTETALRASSIIQATAAFHLISAVIRVSSMAVARVRDAAAAVLPDPKDPSVVELTGQVHDAYRKTRLLALLVPFAKVSTESLAVVYARTFERAAFGFAKMYLFALFLRVLLSWFPGIDWNTNPWTFLRLITEPYLQIYRGILPPLFGQLDFTPLFGFLILQDVVELMAPSYTMGTHGRDESNFWTTSDVMCYFDGH